MSIQYLENPLLFINSTGSSVPKGRNVRTQSRTQQAKGPAKNQAGSFGLLDLNVKRYESSKEDSKPTRKRRKGVTDLDDEYTSTLLQQQNAIPTSRLALSLPAPARSSAAASLKPAEVLAVATFHIRRIAAMTVRAQPSRLREALRCRQWSCVPYALERFGKR